MWQLTLLPVFKHMLINPYNNDTLLVFYLSSLWMWVQETMTWSKQEIISYLIKGSLCTGRNRQEKPTRDSEGTQVIVTRSEGIRRRNGYQHSARPVAVEENIVRKIQCSPCIAWHREDQRHTHHTPIITCCWCLLHWNQVNVRRPRFLVGSFHNYQPPEA